MYHSHLSYINSLRCKVIAYIYMKNRVSFPLIKLAVRSTCDPPVVSYTVLAPTGPKASIGLNRTGPSVPKREGAPVGRWMVQYVCLHGQTYSYSHELADTHTAMLHTTTTTRSIYYILYMSAAVEMHCARASRSHRCTRRQYMSDCVESTPNAMVLGQVVSTCITRACSARMWCVCEYASDGMYGTAYMARATMNCMHARSHGLHRKLGRLSPNL